MARRRPSKISKPHHPNKKRPTTKYHRKIPVDRQKQKQLAWFLGLFVIQIVLFYFLYAHPLVDRAVFVPIANMYAWISGKVLALAGFANMVVGDVISSPESFSVGVKKGCDAAEPMAIFSAGIIAFRAGIKQKLSGLATGLLLLFVLNIIRVSSLYITGIRNPELFETLHLGVWQVVFILAAVILWFIWLQGLPHKTVKV